MLLIYQYIIHIINKIYIFNITLIFCIINQNIIKVSE